MSLLVCHNKEEHLELKPIIAGQDIVCYKVLGYELGAYSCDPELFTIYQHMIIRLGEKYDNLDVSDIQNVTENVEMLVDCGVEIDDDHVAYELNGGFYHSYEFLDDAIEDLHDSCNTGIVIKCIIPKSTEFYVGRDLVGHTSYASRSIIYTNEIEYQTDWHDMNWGEENCQNAHDNFFKFLLEMDKAGIKYIIDGKLQAAIDEFNSKYPSHSVAAPA